LIGTDFVVGNPTLNAQSEDVGLAGTGGRANEQAPRGDMTASRCSGVSRRASRA